MSSSILILRLGEPGEAPVRGVLSKKRSTKMKTMLQRRKSSACVDARDVYLYVILQLLHTFEMTKEKIATRYMHAIMVCTNSDTQAR